MKFRLISTIISVVFFMNATAQEITEATFLQNTRQLIYEGKRSGEGYFSADGAKLIFQSERQADNPFYQIYMLDLETGDSHRVSTGTGKTTCAFIRPGHDEALFGSTHADPDAVKKQQAELDFRASGQKRRYSWDYDENMDIFSSDLKGDNLKNLTAVRGYDAEGSYSPDGSKVVFCSLRDAYGENPSDQHQKQLEMDPSYFGEIYIMDADGSNQTRLTDWPGYDGGPFFSPDGERIIWRHFEENGAVADVYTMKIDGSDRRRLTNFKAMSWAPYFHPSGEYALFASNKLGFANFEIYMVDAKGEKEPVRITFTEGFDGLPVFSPDGKKMAWTTNRTSDKKSQLYIANWNHSAALEALKTAPVRVTSEGGTNGGHGSFEPGTTFYESATQPQTSADEKLSSAIAAEDIQQYASYLASDELEGRMSGTNGTKLAADYLVKNLKQVGLKPLGDNGTFLQKFEFTAGVELAEGNTLEITTPKGKQVFEVEKDFLPLSFTSEEEVEGQVVFAGFGLTVPGAQGEGYNSYNNLDVKDKIVLVLRYVPEQVEVERRQKLNVYAGLRYKALAARQKGAKAVLVISGPNSPRAGKLIPLRYDRSAANSGIVAASVSSVVAQALFASSDKSLEEVQSQLDIENPHFEGRFALEGVSVKIKTGVKRTQKTDYNVVAMLPASAPDATETVILGAHYDHIGFGEIGSLARKGEEGKIHNGADDNASGTSTVLELATYFSGEKKKNPDLFKRNLIFAFWSGEELGLIGSSAFVENAPVPLANIAAYLNFDMVGRLRENKLILQGVGSSSVWKKIIEKRNVVAGFDLTLQDNPYQPTDISAFYPKDVPVLAFFTGSHENYNRPTDDAATLDYDGMQRIAKFAALITKDLLKTDERPDYKKVKRVKSKQGNRDAMRAYLGTIPDYVGGDNGLKLSGVSGGGPADKAGLKGGDIIIELAGQEVKNIYDYTYAIDALKIDEPTDVVVLRDGEKLTLKITPQARE